MSIRPLTPPTAPDPAGPVPAGPVPAGPVPAGPVPTGPVPTGPVPTGPVPTGAGPTAPPPDWATGLLARRSGRAVSSAIRDLLAITARPEVISLAGGLPDPDALPAGWLREIADDLFARRGIALLQYSTTEGDPRLRATVAGWETGWLGRPVGADDVLVCTGSQQALDLVGKALVDPGDVVVVEDPAYLGALQAFRLFDPRLVGVGQDADGLRTDLLERRLAGGLRPKLVYTTPTFHNPAGSTLPAHRRRHLAELAERYGFLIVEDDPYRMLAFGATPPAPVAAHTDRVVRMGSFSKLLAPGLRVGWLVAPAPLRAALVRVKQASDLHTSTLAQELLGAAAADGQRLRAHVGATAGRLRDRVGVLRRALAETFGAALAVGEPAGGMFCWATFTDGTDTAALLPAAVAAGTAFVPGNAFAVDRAAPHALRLCFATTPPEQLAEAVRRLHRAHGGLVRGGPPAG